MPLSSSRRSNWQLGKMVKQVTLFKLNKGNIDEAMSALGPRVGVCGQRRA